MSRFLTRKILCVLTILILTGCEKNKPLVRTAFHMDTLVRISVYKSEISSDSLNTVIDMIFEWMEVAENKLSVHHHNSEVQEINFKAGQEPVYVSDEVYQVVKEGKKIYEHTAGAFDITIGAVKSLWDFYSENPSPPSSKSISQQLKLTGSDHVVLNDSSVLLNKKGMMIDLGGIAKGYVVDKSISILKKAGVKSAIVEAGGDLRILGNHPSKKYWRIGIRHPRIPQGIIGFLDIDAMSVTTSGDYERYFIYNSKRYHHILNPVTGYPAESSISVTVVTSSAMNADAMATAFFVMGPEEAVRFAEANENLDCIVFYEDSLGIQYKISEELNTHFTLLDEDN